MDILTKICVVILLVLILLACPVFITQATVVPKYRAELDDAKATLRTESQIHGKTRDQLKLVTKERDDAIAKASTTDQARQQELDSISSALASEKTRNAELRSRIAQISTELNKLRLDTESNTERTKQLSAQLDKARSSVDKLTEENTKIEEMLNQAEAASDRLNQVVKVLREQLAERDDRIRELEQGVAAGGGIAVEGDVDPGAPALAEKVTGTITAVQDDLASINIGSAKGIRPNMKLIVYRGAEFVGYLRIEEVDVTQAAGLIVDKRVDPQQGDKVTTSLK